VAVAKSNNVGGPNKGGAARRGMGMARGGLPFTPRHSGVGIGAVLGLGSAHRRAGTGKGEPFEGHPGEWADHSPGSQWDGKGDGLPVPKALFTCPVSRLGPECGKNKEIALRGPSPRPSGERGWEERFFQVRRTPTFPVGRALNFRLSVS